MKIRPTLILLSFLYATVAYTQFFSGQIVYSNSFRDLQDKDIAGWMAPFFGYETHYFINDSNYKAYDQDQRPLYLYNATTNTYYFFKPGVGKLDQKDATKKSDEAYATTRLTGTAKICGYDCISIEK